METAIKNPENITKDTPNVLRKKICCLEEALSRMPGAMSGDCYPLKHTFVDGAYVREITMPKGALLTSKIHKICHPYFILKGEVSVLTDKGIVRLKAPHSGITMPGTKRLLYIHEETVWTTVHVTPETDLLKIEESIIAKSFEEIAFNDDDVIAFIGEIRNDKIEGGVI